MVVSRTRWAHCVVAASLLGILAGCSSGTAATAGSTTLAGGGGLRFELTEWKVTPTNPTVAAGRHKMTAVNVGHLVHSVLIISGTDMSNLPVRSDGGIDDAALGTRLAGEIRNVSPGTTHSTSLDLEPGTYTVMCNMAGMAALADQPNAMHTTLTVT